jgi:arsenate reductase
MSMQLKRGIDSCQYPSVSINKTTACCASLLRTRLGRDAAEELATAFTAIADPGGLRPLSFMAAQPGGETCVCNLTCVQNAGRSQMAAGFFNALAGPAKARAISAGTRPATSVHPEVVDAMREVGINLAGSTPTPLTNDLAWTADIPVTVGCGEPCPFGPGLRSEDWNLADPHGQWRRGRLPKPSGTTLRRLERIDAYVTGRGKAPRSIVVLAGRRVAEEDGQETDNREAEGRRRTDPRR